MTAREIFNQMSDMQKFAFKDACRLRDWNMSWDEKNPLIINGERTPLGQELYKLIQG